MPISVTSIYRYPVKSCRGESLERAVVEPWGLAGDRRWMLVDDGGTRVTAREHPRLVLVTPSFSSDNSNIGEGGGGSADNGNSVMRFEAPGLPGLAVPFPRGAGSDLVPVTIGRSTLLAARAGEEAAGWFTRITGKPVRLVYLDDPTRRATDPAYSEAGDRVSFADGYPLLLVSRDSLERLNDWIGEGRHSGEGPLPVSRFRPNVVIGGAPAFAEDDWKKVTIGDVAFRVAKCCDRCVLTTIDPDSAVKDREPLVTLAKHRRWDGKVWFGVNLIPDLPPGEPGLAPWEPGLPPGEDAVIRPGDPVRVLS
jgi:hypothetical protein